MLRKILSESVNYAIPFLLIAFPCTFVVYCFISFDDIQKNIFYVFLATPIVAYLMALLYVAVHFDEEQMEVVFPEEEFKGPIKPGVEKKEFFNYPIFGPDPYGVCPNCHSQNVEHLPGRSIKTLSLFPSKHESQFRCNYCGKEFTYTTRGSSGSLWK